MTFKEVCDLIACDEHKNLELKKTTGELKDGMHSACAFLNTQGGVLVFGVTPNSLKIIGQEVTEATRREVAHALVGLEPALENATGICCSYISEASVWGSSRNLSPKYRTSTEQVPDKYPTSTRQVPDLIAILDERLYSVKEMMSLLKLKDRENFLENHLWPSIDGGFIEKLYPDNPNHPRQKYRLTEKALKWKKGE